MFVLYLSKKKLLVTVTLISQITEIRLWTVLNSNLKLRKRPERGRRKAPCKLLLRH